MRATTIATLGRNKGLQRTRHRRVSPLSLTVNWKVTTVPAMLKLDTARRLLATFLAVALFLGGASQVIASTAMMQCAMSMSADESMSMSSMADDGMGQGEHGMPCPAAGFDCMWTAGCMAAPAIPLAEATAMKVAHPDGRFEITSMGGSSRSIRPALPPPISLA